MVTGSEPMTNLWRASTYGSPDWAFQTYLGKLAPSYIIQFLYFISLCGGPVLITLRKVNFGYRHRFLDVLHHADQGLPDNISHDYTLYWVVDQFLLTHRSVQKYHILAIFLTDFSKHASKYNSFHLPEMTECTVAVLKRILEAHGVYLANVFITAVVH